MLTFGGLRQYYPRINDNINLVITVGQCVCIHVIVTDRFDYLIMLHNYDGIITVCYTKSSRYENTNFLTRLSLIDIETPSLQTKIGPLPLSKGDFDIVMDLINVSSDDDVNTLLVDGTPIRNLIDTLTTNVHLSAITPIWNDNLYEPIRNLIDQVPMLIRDISDLVPIDLTINDVDDVEDLGDDFTNYPYININMDNNSSALSNSNIRLLPPDVLKYLSEFININNLLNTCKELFCPYLELKRSNLSKYNTRKYVYYPSFRNLIDGITTIRKLDIENCSIIDISTLVNIDTLYLDNCPNITDISTLVNINTLWLDNCPNITDISTLVNIDTLWLYNCPNITDISTLVNIDDLTIKNCPITDISTLVNVYELHIANCPITDISTLVNVYELHIENCPITNINTLVNVYELHIENCPITNINTLVNVCKLWLHECHNITNEDLYTFENVNELYLSYCLNITDLSAFINIDDLSIYECTNIRDISVLRNNRKVKIEFCHNITNISSLTNVLDLTIVNCRITNEDLNALGNINTLSLRNCSNITDISSLVNVNNLTIHHCNYISDFSVLRNNHTVKIKHYWNKINIRELGNVYDLTIDDCSITNEDLYRLGNVNTLSLRNCRHITDISSLVNVNNLTIDNCRHIMC